MTSVKKNTKNETPSSVNTKTTTKTPSTVKNNTTKTTPSTLKKNTTKKKPSTQDDFEEEEPNEKPPTSTRRKGVIPNTNINAIRNAKKNINPDPNVDYKAKCAEQFLKNKDKSQKSTSPPSTTSSTSSNVSVIEISKSKPASTTDATNESILAEAAAAGEKARQTFLRKQLKLQAQKDKRDAKDNASQKKRLQKKYGTSSPLSGENNVDVAAW